MHAGFIKAAVQLVAVIELENTLFDWEEGRACGGLPLAASTAQQALSLTCQSLPYQPLRTLSPD